MKNNNDPQFKEFFDGYVEEAARTFTEIPNAKVEYFSPRALEIMEEDCQAFYNQNIHVLEEVESSMDQNGHDFWLARCGHGSGFWDRKYKSRTPDLYNILDFAAKRCHECELYVSDDNNIVIDVYGR